MCILAGSPLIHTYTYIHTRTHTYTRTLSLDNVLKEVERKEEGIPVSYLSLHPSIHPSVRPSIPSLHQSVCVSMANPETMDLDDCVLA